MHSYSLIIISCLIYLSCGIRDDHRNNLVVNPGFEEIQQENPVGWTISTSGENTVFQSGLSDDSFSGKHSMQFGRVWSDAWEMNGFRTSNPVPVDPANKYILTFRYKTENIKEYPVPLVVRVNVGRKEPESLRYQKFISRNNEWTEILWMLDTLPADAHEATIEFSIWIRTQGMAFIDDVNFRIAGPADIERYNSWRRLPEPDLLQEPESAGFPPTGFYTTIHNGNRWWLVDPEGRPTWAIATMGEIPGKSGNGNVHLAEWFEREYGNNRMKYAASQYSLLESWGVNSFAGWTVGEYSDLTAEKYREGKNYFPMYQVLNFSIMGAEKNYYAKNNKGEMKGVHDHSFPDPFNPDWRKDAKEKAVETIGKFAGKPWFAGWFMDNEIDYSSLFEYIWGDYSSVEFIKYLKHKYQTISGLNEKWSSGFNRYDFQDFDDILNNKPSPVEWNDPLYDDFIAFERIMLEEYINFTYGMVRDLDPDHLIISNRLNLDPMMSLYRTIDLWSKYDVVCVNIYPENLFLGFSKGELEIIDWIHEKTGRPVLIGEWSIPAMDSGLYGLGEDPYNRPLDWSWPQVVRNQKERAEAYHTCMLQLASRPWVIGAAWFKVFDVDSPGRRSNRGLINGDHQPYPEFIDVFTETNNQIRSKLNIPW